MVEKRRPIWSSLDVSFSSPTTVDKEPFLCTLKKLYNLYSGFTHYRNYRACNFKVCHCFFILLASQNNKVFFSFLFKVHIKRSNRKY